MLNLDTHILLGAVKDNLRDGERSLLWRVPRWGISGIVLREIETLFRDKRIEYGLDYPGLQAVLETLTIWPVDAETCLALRELDFHSDPADELIAATSLVKRVRLVTRDGRLRNSRLLQRRGLLA